MEFNGHCALVTCPHEQMVRYYGRYSNPSRGKRRQRGLSASDDDSDSLEPHSQTEGFAQQRRRNWARLLKKIYEVDPLTYAQCGSRMEINAFVEASERIRTILQHRGLWKSPERSPPPHLFPHKLEAFLASLTPQQARRIRASTDSVFWDDVPVWTD